MSLNKSVEEIFRSLSPAAQEKAMKTMIELLKIKEKPLIEDLNMPAEIIFFRL
jgi:hypothetical protein